MILDGTPTRAAAHRVAERRSSKSIPKSQKSNRESARFRSLDPTVALSFAPRESVLPFPQQENPRPLSILTPLLTPSCAVVKARHVLPAVTLSPRRLETGQFLFSVLFRRLLTGFILQPLATLSQSLSQRKVRGLATTVTEPGVEKSNSRNGNKIPVSNGTSLRPVSLALGRPRVEQS